jgi:hypothetical protein
VTAASLRSRLLLAAALLGLAFATAAGAAVNGASAGWYMAPKRIVQGNPMKVEVSVPRGTRCSLSFTYKGGAKQKGLRSLTARNGKAAWEFEVPKKATPGPARARLVCSGHRSATFVVMIIGEVIPATIEVVKQGFSIRPKRFGSGADSSWGVILKNTSPQSDAFDVIVLANYVMPDNKLIGSATERIGRVARGTEFAVGGDLAFPSVPPVVRLEIVVQIGKSARLPMTFPGIANVRVVSDRFDPAIVGSVEGEVVNDNAQKTMERSTLGTVVFDGAGNILGGQSGSAFASLPPGAREFFKITGMRAVDFGAAASAMVSVVPSYRGDPRP